MIAVAMGVLVGLTSLLGVPTSAFASGFSGSGYRYAGEYQNIASPDYVTGVQANMMIAAPYVENSGSHSLSEIALSAGPSNGNAVEFGFAVEPTAFGDYKPRLFACIWVLSVTQPGCYTGNDPNSGWFDNSSNPIDLGADLSSVASATSPANAKQFKIQQVSGINACTFSANGWELDYDGVKVGCFRGDKWSHAGTSFTQATRVQAFGEYYYNKVISTQNQPCGDIGNGQYGSQNPLGVGGPAYFGSLTLLGKSSGYVTEDLTPDGNSLVGYDSAGWTVYPIPGSVGNRTFGYGGPGYTSGGASPGNIGSC